VWWWWLQRLGLLHGVHSRCSVDLHVQCGARIRLLLQLLLCTFQYSAPASQCGASNVGIKLKLCNGLDDRPKIRSILGCFAPAGNQQIVDLAWCLDWELGAKTFMGNGHCNLEALCILGIEGRPVRQHLKEQ
jgi:hypothetical protein